MFSIRSLKRFALACATLASFAPAHAAVTVIEYYHAGFDHYFVTSLPDEIVKLDNGTLAGWTRTGKQFSAYNLTDPGTSPTCRFFSTAFGAKSSHFYTPYVAECNTVKTNPSWQFEAQVFGVALPDAAGNCPGGTVALYRLYNNGKGGAPNHRYTTELGTRSAMLAQGWIAEGAGSGVIACLPSVVPQSPEGFWVGLTSTNQAVAGFVLDDGTFHFLYSLPGSSNVGGVVTGTLSQSGNAFTSSDAREFDFYAGIFNATVSGTYVPRSSMSGAIAANGASAAFSLNYDSRYQQPVALATVAGTYAGSAGTSQGFQSVTFVLTSTGSIIGSATGCTFSGTAAPRGATAIFDVSVRFNGGLCLFGTSTLSGMAFYDTTDRTIYVIAPNASRTDGFLFIGSKP